MRIGTVNTPSGPRAVVAVDGDRLVDLNASDPSLPADTVQLLKLGPDALRRAASAAGSAQAKTLPYEPANLGPAVTPGKLFCIGRNYAAHAAETGSEVPEKP